MSRLADVIYENNTERRAVAGDLDACPPAVLWQVRLKIDHQSFSVGDPTDADHADWMRRQLANAIARRVEAEADAARAAIRAYVNASNNDDTAGDTWGELLRVIGYDCE